MTAPAADGAVVILVYHGVAELAYDTYRTAVSPERFEAQIRRIAESYWPLRMTEVVDGLVRRALPRRAVAVTFDDGYANNLATALPVLERYEVPATVFVATGYTGAGREFWWDELERLTLEGTDQPGGAERARQAWRRMHRLPPEQISAELERLWRDGAGRSAPPAPRETHRPMTVQELRDISKSGLVELGGHSRSHPVLAAIDPTAQRHEIADSREDLAQWLGEPPNGFAYPYGEPGRDYSAAATEIVRELGFSYAVSSRAGVTSISTPRYELPRFFVSDWSSERFDRWLDTRFRSGPVRVGRKVVRTLRTRRD